MKTTLFFCLFTILSGLEWTNGKREQEFLPLDVDKLNFEINSYNNFWSLLLKILKNLSVLYQTRKIGKGQTCRKITKLLKSQRLISRTRTSVQTKLKRARLNGCLHMIMLMNSMTMNTKHMITDHRMIDFRQMLLVVKIFRRRKIRQYWSIEFWKITITKFDRTISRNQPTFQSIFSWIRLIRLRKQLWESFNDQI